MFPHRRWEAAATYYKFHFEENPIWYSTIKFTKLHSIKCSLHKVCFFELYKFDPFSPHSRLIPQELVHSYASGCLWVVTVCCNTVGQHGQSFLSHTHSMNNLRWQLHRLPRLTSLPRKSRDWWRTRDCSLDQPTENKIDYKPTLKKIFIFLFSNSQQFLWFWHFCTYYPWMFFKCSNKLYVRIKMRL